LSKQWQPKGRQAIITEARVFLFSY